MIVAGLTIAAGEDALPVEGRMMSGVLATLLTGVLAGSVSKKIVHAAQKEKSS
jgi:hypothetical protein